MDKPLTRKQKLCKLRNYIDLETGVIHERAFTETWELYQRAKETSGFPWVCQSKKQAILNAQISECRKCPGLNMPRVTEAAPGWGSLDARILFIGQSLHEPGVATGIPFILGSGLLIDAALILSGIKRAEVFWTNTIKCRPLRNRQSTPGEKQNCRVYLKQELLCIMPDFVVPFGNDAQQAVDMVLSQRALAGLTTTVKRLNLKHPAALYRNGTAEARVGYVLRLSNALDKYREPRNG